MWTLNGPALGNVPATNVSPGLVSFVHQRHLAQLSQESIDNWVSFHASVSSAAQLRNAILQAFTVGGATGAGAILALDPSIDDGHAVVAYDIQDTGGGAFDILVYNCDVPFTPAEDLNTNGQRAIAASNSVIHVQSNGSWTASLNTGSPMSGGVFNITVIPWNTIPFQPTFPWPEVIGVVGLAVAVIWLIAGDASLTQSSDGNGRTLLANGQWNIDPASALPGARPMPNWGGLGKKTPPAFVSNGSGSLTHVVTGSAAGVYDLYWLGPGCGVTLPSVPTAAGAVDSAAIGPGSVSVTPDRAKAMTIALLNQSSGKTPRTATLKTSASANAAVALSYDATADTFTYRHAGAAATYTMTLSSFDAQGKAVAYTTGTIQVNSGDTHTFSPDWANLAAGAGTLAIRAANGVTTTGLLKPAA